MNIPELALRYNEFFKSQDFNEVLKILNYKRKEDLPGSLHADMQEFFIHIGGDVQLFSEVLKSKLSRKMTSWGSPILSIPRSLFIENGGYSRAGSNSIPKNFSKSFELLNSFKKYRSTQEFAEFLENLGLQKKFFVSLDRCLSDLFIAVNGDISAFKKLASKNIRSRTSFIGEKEFYIPELVIRNPKEFQFNESLKEAEEINEANFVAFFKRPAFHKTLKALKYSTREDIPGPLIGDLKALFSSVGMDEGKFNEIIKDHSIRRETLWGDGATIRIPKWVIEHNKNEKELASSSKTPATAELTISKQFKEFRDTKEFGILIEALKLEKDISHNLMEDLSSLFDLVKFDKTAFARIVRNGIT